MEQLLNYLEDKDIAINNDWFYHAIPFSHDNYLSVLNNGILSPYLLKNQNNLYQYVFVSCGNKSKYTAFTNYSIYPNFIIKENIAAIKSNDGYIKKLMYGGFHGLRFASMYDDEYQVYKKIKPEDIIGILFNLEKLITSNKEKPNYYLTILYDIVVLLNELESTIPIIDYYTRKEINKQKVLSLTKDKVKTLERCKTKIENCV
ncbi:MAG: hypothetical protein E7172_05990 [Firmicutes bacterium]|nr:hypothetical protein [Bacillota bacterium]